MKLYIDDVRMDTVKKVLEYYPVDGVTSNPTVLMKGGEDPTKVLPAMRRLIGQDRMLMSQVVSTTAEDMVREAHVLRDLIADEAGENYFVKLPANREGIKAIKRLAAEGEVRCNATGIYSVTQGFLAAEAGAKTCAPYINRMDNLGGDGLQVTRDIWDIIRANGYDMTIVPGSIKSVRQILECAKMGIAGVAIAADVFDQLLANPTVDAAVDAFNADFATLVGEGKTYLDLV